MNSSNNSRRTRKPAPRTHDREDLDAVIDIRSRRRCHYQRSGLDSISLAVHLWAETGDVSGWNDNVDEGLDDDGDGGWTA